MYAFNQKALFPFQISAKRRLFALSILYSDWSKSASHWCFDQSERRTQLAFQMQKARISAHPVYVFLRYVLIESLKYGNLHHSVDTFMVQSHMNDFVI